LYDSLEPAPKWRQRHALLKAKVPEAKAKPVFGHANLKIQHPSHQCGCL
jgi:hypothetical protein